MSLDVLYQPSPLYIPVILLSAFILRCIYFKRWLEMEKCVEIIAFSAGIYAASTMFLRAFSIQGEGPEMAWALFTGAAVTGLASVRGAWVVFSSIKSRVDPQSDTKNSPLAVDRDMTNYRNENNDIDTQAHD